MYLTKDLPCPASWRLHSRFFWITGLYFLDNTYPWNYCPSLPLEYNVVENRVLVHLILYRISFSWTECPVPSRYHVNTLMCWMNKQANGRSSHLNEMWACPTQSLGNSRHSGNVSWASLTEHLVLDKHLLVDGAAKMSSSKTSLFL